MIDAPVDMPGNASSPEPSDEDIANAARIALWRANPQTCRGVRISVEDGNVTITGTVASEAELGQIEAAIFDIDGISGITNLVRVDAAPMAPALLQASRAGLAVENVEPRPMLYVTRHCSTDPVAITAAVQNGLETLDARLAEIGLAATDEVAIVFRDRQPDSVVIDICYVMDGDVAPTAEIKPGVTPGGPMLTGLAEDGADGVLATYDQLHRTARLANLLPSPLALQRVPLSQARRLTGPIHVPLA